MNRAGAPREVVRRITADAGGVAVFVRVTNSEDGADALSPTTDIVPPVAPPRPSYWAELVPKLNIKDVRMVGPDIRITAKLA